MFIFVEKTGQVWGQGRRGGGGGEERTFVNKT